MTPKILRLIAVLFTALATLLILPRFIKTGGGNYAHIYTDAVYSEVLGDFILSRYEYSRQNGHYEARTLYTDTRGNLIEKAHIDSLCPLANASQLAFENRFPDSIGHRRVTAREAEAANFRFRISVPALDYGLYDLIDSHSYLSQQFNSEDLMRFTPHGIEFIRPENNRIDKEKSERFDHALKAKGFTFPLKYIWSPTNRTDTEQQGFFLIDQNKQLFRLSMTEGTPMVETISRPEGKDIIQMSFCDEPDFLALIVASDGNSYLFPRHRESYLKLPLPSLLGKSAQLRGNLFYYSFTLESADSLQYIVTDKAGNLVAQYAQAREIPKASFTLGEYLLPLRITQSAQNGIGIKLGDFPKFIIVNLLLAILTFFIRRRQNYNTAARFTDTTVVALLGLGGMAGVFAIPHHRNAHKDTR